MPLTSDKQMYEMYAFSEYNQMPCRDQVILRHHIWR